MSYHQPFICKSLCESTRSIVTTLVMADCLEKLTEFLFALGEACYVTYDTKYNTVLEAEYLILDLRGVSIYIQLGSQSIRGYVDGTEIYSCDIPIEVAEILTDIAERRWASEYLQTNQDPDDTSGIVTVALTGHS